MLIIMETLSEKHLKHEVDSMCRWSWLTLRVKKETEVLIISAYRVFQEYTNTVGNTTACIQ